jgi:thiol-disulfide isomerase/thioredoxin
MNPRRILLRAAVAVLATAAFALSACSGKDAVDQNGNPTFKFGGATPVGKVIASGDRTTAANFSGDLLGGGKTSLAKSAGKVVVLNFWASWCGPCQAETPQFDLLYRRIHTKGVDFLGIDTKDIKSHAVSFVEDKDITYPIVFDETGETALALGNIPASLPFTVLLDKQGKVAAVYLARLASKDLEGPIDKLLAET